MSRRGYPRLSQGEIIKAITNAKIVLGSEIVEGKTVLFNRKIVAVESDVDLDNIEVIDAKGAYLSPGFIDIHIHGSGGADVMDATPEALETISATLLQTGTTAFLATTMTMSQQAIIKALENVRFCKESVSGAQILGVHLEGPFINPCRHGAQDMQYVQKPSWGWLESYADIVRMVTLAPEVEGGMDFVETCRKSYPDMILSIGHSEATYEVCMEAFDKGVTHVTHLFNAMPPYHHRKPGIVGACFDTQSATCDIIADLVHTHPHHLRLTGKMKSAQLLLITDAMRAGCMKSGSYDLGGQHVTVSKGKALLKDGTLAGSVLTMNRALKHMLMHTEMTLSEVVYSATEAPAKKLGVMKGVLKAGYDADFVMFDEDFSIISTFISGEAKYQRSL
jgi:N-acetylglucosamine-6-phosphate deacetylase